MTAVLAHLPAVHLHHTPCYIASPRQQRTPRDRRQPLTERDANSCSSNMTGRGRGKAATTTAKTGAGNGKGKGKPKVVNFDLDDDDDDDVGFEAPSTGTTRKGAVTRGKTAVNGRHRESESPRTRSKRKARKFVLSRAGYLVLMLCVSGVRRGH